MNHVKKIHNLSIGIPQKMIYENGKEMNTGICKESVNDAFLTKDGFQGDGVANLLFHGGSDRAVCIYPYEHYKLWESEFKTTLPASTFGENLTVMNMLEKDVHIGDIFQVGEAVIQVTQSRIPCSTITKRTKLPLLLKRMVETGYTGYLCRVLEEGLVRKDSQITLLKQHREGLSVLVANDIYFQRLKDKESIQKLLNIQELATSWRESLIKRLEKMDAK
ncbi:MOSC domain-containing protein [Sporosarcina sp. Marseille-Q4063]|uniref:MOSC domain-containing protein n=1 Tax=Sporosarcina sp. Marseille-Q4063 TaxID=2810514 RepID=UPI001BAF4E5E|nr:MOSC domain-containing protein [Sporosarcina sp. Marseille-Q4063]QUW22958.1 MOSC domain-containing protein [Sporosarcina sp. Marseille-Q4063]